MPACPRVAVSGTRDPACRRMYDAITLQSPELPSGVTMVDVVRDSDEAELLPVAADGTVLAQQVHCDLENHDTHF